MKKAITFITVALLALSLLAGCSQEKQLAPGVTTDTQYSSEMIGIRFTLPAEWHFASEEEVAQAMQLASAVTFADSEDFATLAKSQPSITDVIAKANNGGAYLSISIINLEKLELDVSTSSGEYTSTIETQLKEMDIYKDAVFTAATHSLGGQEFSSLTIDSTDSFGLFHRQYCKQIRSGYLVTVSITSLSAEETDAIAAMFAKM